MLGGVAFLLLLLWAGTAGAAEDNHLSSHTCSISTPVFLPLIARSFRHPQGYLIDSGSLGLYLFLDFAHALLFLGLTLFSRACSGLLSCSCFPASNLPANSYPLHLLDLDPCLFDLPACSPPTAWRINYIFCSPLKDLCVCICI